MANDKKRFWIRATDGLHLRAEQAATKERRDVNDWLRAVIEIAAESDLSVTEISEAIEFAKAIKAKHAIPFSEILKKNAKQ